MTFVVRCGEEGSAVGQQALVEVSSPLPRQLRILYEDLVLGDLLVVAVQLGPQGPEIAEPFEIAPGIADAGH